MCSHILVVQTSKNQPVMQETRVQSLGQEGPVFLPGKSHGQWSLTGYSPLGSKELDTTERLSMRTHTHTHLCVHAQAW